MFKKMIVKRICILFAMVMMINVFCPTHVFAKTMGPESNNYIGNIVVNDAQYGKGLHTINASWAQIVLAWKPGEYWLTNPSNVYVKVWLKDTNNNGKDVGYYEFHTFNDGDGADGDGYYYVGSDWFNIPKGHTYQLYYDICTEYGERGTGNRRKADIHAWIVTGAP